MIKMTYNELTNVRFLQAIQKLANMPMRSPAVFRLKYIANALEKQREKIQSDFKKDILARYAKGGETPAAPGPSELAEGIPFAVIEGMEASARTALKEFGEQSFEISQPKIAAENLSGEWSAAELAILEPLVEEPQE